MYKNDRFASTQINQPKTKRESANEEERKSEKKRNDDVQMSICMLLVLKWKWLLLDLRFRTSRLLMILLFMVKNEDIFFPLLMLIWL